MSLACASFIRWSVNKRGFYKVRQKVLQWARTHFSGYNLPVSYFEGLLWVNVGHKLEWRLFKFKVFEPGTIHLIRLASSKGFSFVDVGAHIGTHLVAAAMSRRSADQRFIGFEAEPETLGTLRWNLRKNRLDSITEIYPFALSDAEGTTPFYVNQGDHPGMNGFKRREADQVCIDVPTKRLDQVLDPDFAKKVILKIDVEGAEPLVLDGARQLLSSASDLVLIVEHEVDNLNRAGFTRTAVTERLAAAGFKFWKIDEANGRLLPFNPENETFCNYLAAKSLPSFWRDFCMNETGDGDYLSKSSVTFFRGRKSATAIGPQERLKTGGTVSCSRGPK
jgi:FkbM family methyltransferase